MSISTTSIYSTTLYSGNLSSVTNSISPSYTLSYPNITSASTVSWNAGSMIDGSDIQPATLKVKGDADFEGDVRINGKSLTDMLVKIEEKLAILHPNEELEEKWEQLRGLRKMYMELEAEIKEKEQMWAILKK